MSPGIASGILDSEKDFDVSSVGAQTFTMWDKVVQFRRQAQDCKDRAAGARDPIDEDAWLKLAEEWLALASANEAARNVQNTPALNAHSASE
jgi:hypothetical protein